MKTDEENKGTNELLDTEAARLKANARKKMDKSTRKTNKLWLWLGVLLLVFILVWWLWSIGTIEDITGITNG